MPPEEQSELSNLKRPQENNPGKNAVRNLTDLVKTSCMDAKEKLKGFWELFPQKAQFLISFIICVLLFYSVANLLIKSLNKDLKGNKTLISNAENWDKLVISQREPQFFTMSAYSGGKFGILPNEILLLKTANSIDPEFVKSNIYCNFPIDIQTMDANTYKIEPVDNIGTDKVLEIKLNVKNKESNNITFDRDYSWVFQTQEKFKIVKTTPGNQKKEVPTDTGIEIVFSQDDYEDPEKYISISPSIDFKIERHENTLVIVPVKQLEEMTVYTVIIKKGLNLRSRNDPLNSNFVFSFQTGEKTNQVARFHLIEDFVQTGTKENLQAKVHTSYWDKGRKIRTNVYIFKNSDDFIKARSASDRYRETWSNYYARKEKFDTGNLSKVLSADIEIQEQLLKNGTKVEYLQLPDTLPKGFYIAELSYGDNYEQTQQIWIQSTDLTGYVSVGKEQTLVWSNLLGGKTAKSATVTLVGSDYIYKTDDNGIVVFKTPAVLFEKEIKYLLVEYNDNKLFLEIYPQSAPKPGEKTPEDYWSYFYHDRKVYKPTDRIDFFGIVKNRATNKPPTTVTASLYKNYYVSSENESGEKIISSKTITPGNDGSFIGYFDFQELPEDYYLIKVIADGIEIISDGVNIKSFKKPEISIEVVGDKKAVFAGEKVNFEINAKFFDGTPVSNTSLNVRKSLEEPNNNGGPEKVITDLYGHASYTYETKYKDKNYSYPAYEYITIEPVNPHEANTEGYGSTRVFGSKVILSTNNKQNGKNAVLTITANRVDLSAINNGTGNEYKGEQINGQEIEIILTKKWWEKVENGTYYDFVEKKTEKSYIYKQHSEDAESKKIKTDSKGSATYNFDIEEGKSYVVTARAKDENEHYTETRSYFYAFSYENEEGAYPQLEFENEKYTFSKGDNVKARIKMGSEIYPDNDQNKFLFIIANDGTQKAVVKDDPEYNFTFEKQYIPNVDLAAIIYTGKNYLKTEPQTKNRYLGHGCFYFGGWGESSRCFNGGIIRYNKEDANINLTIDSSKSANKPGGNAKIRITASKNGAPLKNASVNITLVDQALKAIDVAVEPRILSELYKDRPSFVYYNYSSHEPIIPEIAEAEMGGGSGDVRSVFKDSAYFGLKKTDENGISEFEFDLPDNITTWIIYAQATDDNTNAGWTEGKLIATKDFFVNAQFPDQYTYQESPAVTGNSFGTTLKADDNINYEVSFHRDTTELTRESKTEKAYKTVTFDFPQLEIGTYNLTLMGRTGNKEDGIKLPFTVIEPRFFLENNIVKTLGKGEEQSSIEIPNAKTDKPITVIISDAGKGAYYKPLKKHCYTESNRFEKLLSSMVTSKILKEKFNDGCEKTYEGINLFQNPDGGLSQVAWGNSDLETTAWAVYIDSESFDKDTLIKYFEENLSEATKTKNEILASWGLTKLGKPQITKLDSIRSKAVNFDEKITLGIAYASIGDMEKARDIYYESLSGWAYTSGPYIRIQNPQENTQTANIISTSYALLLGEMVDSKYNDGLSSYIRDFKGRTENLVLDLSEVLLIEEQISKLPSDENTQIYLKTPSIEKNVDLTVEKSVISRLSPGDINNFYVKVLDGKADIQTNYFADINGVKEMPQSKGLKITRTINKIGDKNSKKIETGDIIKIRIDFDVDRDSSPPGLYLITDYLPSGLKYISNPTMFGLEATGWTSNNGQVVTYLFYNPFCKGNIRSLPCFNQLYTGNKYFVYYARAGSVGTYKAEPASIQSQREFEIFKTTTDYSIKINNLDK